MSETNNQDITEVRRRLFAVMDGLTDKENPMEIERAKAVVDAAQTIINSAKVEVDHMKVAGGKGSGFLPLEQQSGGVPQVGVTKTQNGEKSVVALPGGRTVTTHRLK